MNPPGGEPKYRLDEHSFLEGTAKKYRKLGEDERDGESCWVGRIITTETSEDSSVLTGSQVQFPDVNEVLANVLKRRAHTRFLNTTVLSPYSWCEDLSILLDPDGVCVLTKNKFRVSSEVPQSVRNGFAFPTVDKPCLAGANLETLFEEYLKWQTHFVLVNPEQEDLTRNISNRPWYNIGKFHILLMFHHYHYLLSQLIVVFIK